MVLDIIFSLSLFSFLIFFAYFFTFLFFFTSAFICLYLYFISMFLSICYASTFIFSFLHVRTFKIYFLLYNLSTCAPPSLFSICYIYQLTHVTSPCLALLAYHFIKTLNHIAIIFLSLFLLCLHFLRLQRHFHSNDIFLTIQKNRYVSMRSRESQVRLRRFSRCDCRTRYTVACYHQEFATRATCAARLSPRSSL